MADSNIFLTPSDIEILDKNIESIQNEVEEIKKVMFEMPTTKDKLEILKIVEDFVRERKRKIYGGYALNELIILSGKDKPIYESHVDDEGEVKDIDFYTPDPINDIMDLADLLHKKGYTNILCQESVHNETYGVKVDNMKYCDASYVPKNIYNRMPFKTNERGLLLIHPHFMWIDYLRMLTDPINSWFRIEKGYHRFAVLQKCFKFPQNLAAIDTGDSSEELDSALFHVINFAKNKPSLLSVGFHAYNHFLKQSGIPAQKGGRGKGKSKEPRQRTAEASLKYLNVPYYEFISTNYKEDAMELITSLKETFGDKDITYVEHYPFFQFFGYNVSIKYKGDLIAKVYSHNRRCTPFHEAEGEFMSANVSDHRKLGGKLYFGSFSMALIYVLINIQYYRANNDDDMKELFYVVASHLIYMRRFFYDTSGKNLLTEGPFREMEIKCTGKTISTFAEQKERITKRKKEGKRLKFNYDPQFTISKRPKIIFLNTSGNPINNEKNLRLFTDKPVDESSDDDVDVNSDTETSDSDGEVTTD